MLNDAQGSCEGSDFSLDVVYAITPDVAGNVEISTSGVSADAQLGVYVRSACADAGSELGCTGHPAAGQSATVKFIAAGGTTYFVFVDGVSSGGAAAFSLSASLTPAGTGSLSDACTPAASAIAPGQTISLMGDTTTAAADLTMPEIGSCAGTVADPTEGPDQVIAVTPSASGTLKVDVDPGSSDLDPVIYVSTACGDAAKAVGCANESGGGPETLSVPVTAGSTYFVVIDAAQAGLVGTYAANITLLP
jgi:hypothetical protein